MANVLDELLNGYDFENDYMPLGVTNESSADLPNQVHQTSTGAPWVGNAPTRVGGMDPNEIQEEDLSDESDTEIKLLEDRVRYLEGSLDNYRKGNLHMSKRMKELPSKRALRDLQVKLGEMSKNMENLQSKVPEIYAKDKNRDLQHTQLSEKIESLQGWANDMKGTLDRVVNAVKYMRGENENTTAPNRQKNNQRLRRSRVG
ncbi:uncharacterized protein BHQ10_007512 [Talaromyces amestolkiae]|uniref:Uncharacterized protein n=1 Tax=Talaromyces amestolkiae TaxID=1196081 RepID=A0A364L6Q0_TALAM|nr:uncharacterized protein BHQ10_007512 [Talaromyces amestolkiae]RAO71500.1 hypothetical protein BHQ10_007512 [Talaromyces amestolkiae]